MSIREIFSQLQQAYLLIELVDWRPVVVNQTACELFSCTLESLPQSELWESILLPVLQRWQTTPDAIVVCNQQRLQASCSEISQDGYCYLTVHFTLAKPSGQELQHFYSMLDNLGAYVYCKDLHYNYTYANQQVCNLFGYPLEA